MAVEFARGTREARSRPPAASPAAPGPAARDRLLALQRSAGNAAVARLIAGGPALARTGRRLIQREGISKEEVEDLALLARSIMSVYPPERFVYVGLGKSPTPLVAFLQEIGQEAVNLPLSAFRHVLPGRSASPSSGRDKPLTGPQQAELTRHFDNFVPEGDDLGERDILLIDLTTTGASLVATGEYLTRYLNERYGPKGFLCWRKQGERVPRIELAALKTPGLIGGGSFSGGVQGVDMPERLAPKMGDEDRYKPRAEYPQDFRIGTGAKASDLAGKEDPRGMYAALRAQIQTILEENPQLVKVARATAEELKLLQAALAS